MYIHSQKCELLVVVISPSYCPRQSQCPQDLSGDGEGALSAQSTRWHHSPWELAWQRALSEPELADQQLLEADTPSQVLVLSGVTQAASLTSSDGFLLIRSRVALPHDAAPTLWCRCVSSLLWAWHFLCSPGYAKTEGGTWRGRINLSLATIPSLLSRRLRQGAPLPASLSVWIAESIMLPYER